MAGEEAETIPQIGLLDHQQRSEEIDIRDGKIYRVGAAPPPRPYVREFLDDPVRGRAPPV